MAITSTRASKRTYLSEVGGTKIVPFQFSPASLAFSESGSYSDILKTGEFFPDMVWISGKANHFDFQFFIDRTQESLVSSDYNKDPFSSVKRFPLQNPKYNVLDSIGLVQGILRGSSASGFQTSIFSTGGGSANDVTASTYSASPEFKQDSLDANIGVINDLEDILYFVRPKGINLSRATVAKDGTVSVTDFGVGRFTPPPKCRFFHGNMWREGYITDVDYTLSVMNKNLVPQRLDAKATFACTKWGYLNELSASYMQSTDVDASQSNTNPLSSASDWQTTG